MALAEGDGVAARSSKAKKAASGGKSGVQFYGVEGIRRIALGVTAVVTAPFAISILLDLSDWSLYPKDTFEYEGAEAKEEFEVRMSSLLALPKEARVLALKREDDWVDQNFWVTFQLPREKPPEKWLREIWESNKFAKGSRESQFVYSAYHWDKPDDRFRKNSKLHHGLREVRFEPESGHYVAVIRTD